MDTDAGLVLGHKHAFPGLAELIVMGIWWGTLCDGDN